MNKVKYGFFTLLVFGLVMSASVEAEARRGGSSFSSSRSSSSSSSWGSSSRSKPSRPSATSTRKSSGSSWGSSSKATAPKSTRATKMSSAKKTQYQNRSKATKATVTKTTPKDWSNSKSKYTSNRNYTPRKDVSYGKKYSPAERNVYRQRYNNTYGGYYYNDPYDHSLIWGFSSLWWYHHWSSVDRAHYGNDARMKEIELEVANMKALGNVTRNTSYKDPNMDDTAMYSTGYMQGVKNGTLRDKPNSTKGKSTESTVLLIFFIILGVVFVGGITAMILTDR